MEANGTRIHKKRSIWRAWIVLYAVTAAVSFIHLMLALFGRIFVFELALFFIIPPVLVIAIALLLANINRKTTNLPIVDSAILLFVLLAMPWFLINEEFFQTIAIILFSVFLLLDVNKRIIHKFSKSNLFFLIAVFVGIFSQALLVYEGGLYLFAVMISVYPIGLIGVAVAYITIFIAYYVGRKTPERCVSNTSLLTLTYVIMQWPRSWFGLLIPTVAVLVLWLVILVFGREDYFQQGEKLSWKDYNGTLK